MDDTNTTGKYLRLTAEKVGLGINSHVHAVGDGAQWIVNQLQCKFGNITQNNLPIGSGKIEGGHRHVIQSRLKISGAWWLKENANAMLALRTTRINK